MSRGRRGADDLDHTLAELVARFGIDAVRGAARRLRKKPGPRPEPWRGQANETVWLLVKLCQERNGNRFSAASACRLLCKNTRVLPTPVALLPDPKRGVIASMEAANWQTAYGIFKRIDREIRGDPQHPLRARLARYQEGFHAGPPRLG